MAFFPTVIYRKDEYLVVEWVEGESFQELNWTRNPKWVEQITKLQHTLHNYSFPDHPSNIDYSMFLAQRLIKHLGPFEPTSAIKAMLNIVMEEHLDSQACLCHFDMTPTNMVIDRTSGCIKLIDNELLTQSSYYPMDFFNSYSALQKSSSMQRFYMDAYLGLCNDLDFVLENKSYFQAVWGLRTLGSMMQSGEYDMAFEIADQLLNFEHPFYTALLKGSRQ
jgi:hypothetical protein